MSAWMKVEHSPRLQNLTLNPTEHTPSAQRLNVNPDPPPAEPFVEGRFSIRSRHQVPEVAGGFL